MPAMHSKHQTAFIGWSSCDTSERTQFETCPFLVVWFTKCLKTRVRYPFTNRLRTAFAHCSVNREMLYCLVLSVALALYWLVLVVLACTGLGVVVVVVLNKCCTSVVPVQQTLYRTWRLALYFVLGN
jgi:hypothetical protein